MLRLLFLMVDAIDKFLDLLLPPAPKPTVRPTPPRRDGMEPGSEVVVLDDPWEWGVGRIDSVGVDGKIRVYFKRDGKSTVVESFDLFNLETLERFMETDGTLTLRELRELATPDTRKQG